MARLVFGMNVSLDGYVDHTAFGPGPKLFRHFIEQARGQAGSVYGGRMYEIMRYWDDDRAEWGPDEHDFAAAWRGRPKWVVSRSLKQAGPNASLIEGDPVAAVRRLKAEIAGEIEIAGPNLASGMTASGLIDEYRLYFHPVVLGGGQPFFVDQRPRLRLAASEKIDDEVIRLTYLPAEARTGT